MTAAALGAVIGAFVTSVILTGGVRAVARRRGYVDRPGGHKQHDNPVALGGGIAITWTVCLPVLAVAGFARWASEGHTPEWMPAFVQTHLGGLALKAPVAITLIACALALHVVGLIDDARPIGPAVKFAVQALAALAPAVMFDVRLLQLAVVPQWASLLLTVFWVVLIVNAFNFLDNMDGLSAGVAAIAGTIFALAALGSGQIFVPVMMLLLVGALLGYLVFNFPPASIFMGDAGSLVVGYLMAELTILTTYYNPELALHPAGVFLPIVVLAVPLYDVGSVIVHRRRAGVSIFRGDRRHFSHRLVQRGFSTRAAVLTIYLATAATSLGAILLPHVDWLGAALIFGQCACVVLIIAILEHTKAKSRAE